jgi:hypothetical protein
MKIEDMPIHLQREYTEWGINVVLGSHRIRVGVSKEMFPNASDAHQWARDVLKEAVERKYARRQPQPFYGVEHNRLIGLLADAGITLTIEPTGGGCWNFQVDSTQYDDWLILLGNCHVDFYKSDWGVCPIWDAGYTDECQEIEELLKEEHPWPTHDSSLEEVAEWMIATVRSFEAQLVLQSATWEGVRDA